MNGKVEMTQCLSVKRNFTLKNWNGNTSKSIWWMELSPQKIFFLNATRQKHCCCLSGFCYRVRFASLRVQWAKFVSGLPAHENATWEISVRQTNTICDCASILLEECVGKVKRRLGHRVLCPVLLPLKCWSQAKAFRRNAAPFYTQW